MQEKPYETLTEEQKPKFNVFNQDGQIYLRKKFLDFALDRGEKCVIEHLRAGEDWEINMGNKRSDPLQKKSMLFFIL